MSNPQTEIKIERAVESIESLTLAIVANNLATDASDRRNTYQSVQDAREECKTALRDFITPTLRVV